MCGRPKRGVPIVAALCAICLLKAYPALVHGQTETSPSPPTSPEVEQKPPAVPPTPHHHTRGDDGPNADLLKQVLTKKCLHRYTTTCLKLDLVRLIDRLGTAHAYQVLPGVSLVRTADDANHTATGHSDHHQQNRHHGIPQDVIRSLVRGNDSAKELDGYLMEKVDAYLNSLSISVKLVDSSAVESVRKFSSQMLVNILPTNLLETGRKKNQGMNAALWSAGTLAAVGFASLAAMSGKALMTAMLALVLAAVCALRGQGGGGGGGGGGSAKTSHYEIITKPAIYEHDHLVHGGSYSAAPYSYARHLIMDETDSSGGHRAAGGRGLPRPLTVDVANAVPAAGAAAPVAEAADPGRPVPSADEGEGGGTVDRHPSYPLSPVTYIPTNNT